MFSFRSKVGGLVIVSASLGLVLSGCSGSGGGGSSPTPSSPGVSDVVELDFSVAEAEIVDVDLATVVTPSVMDVTDDSFVLVDGGSGSCPNVIDGVSFDEASNVILVSYEQLPEETACTMDFVLKPQVVTLKDSPVTVSSDLWTFEVKNIMGTVTPAPVVEADAGAAEES